MIRPRRDFLYLMGLVGVLSTQAFATVKVTSMRPSAPSPKMIGTTITWNTRATDSTSGPLTFQFWVAPPGGTFALVKDFNVGVLKSGVWEPFQTLVWTPTGPEGVYQIKVVVKDFASGDTAQKIDRYHVLPMVSGSNPAVAKTANPLVALFSTPSCPAGSMVRAAFQQQGGSAAAINTNWVNCATTSSTFEIGGMYPSTTYEIFAQVMTGSNITNGPMVTFTTGALPKSLPFPTYTTLVAPGPQTDTADGLILHTLTRSSPSTGYPALATDLSGNIMWYYFGTHSTENLLTRPLPNGQFLSIESKPAWNPNAQQGQYLRQLDLAGNLIRETNTGVIQQSLQALGAKDAQACDKVARPPVVGAACLGNFHHEAMQSLPNGYTAVIADIEKIFPAGTQNDKSKLPVDVVGDIIIVLDTNWQPVWYFDVFDHDTGAPQLDITREAILKEPCSATQGCPFTYLLGTGVAPTAKDWIHANTVYYWPLHGDIVWSSRNQDWVMRIDYNNGTGTGNIIWRMGHDGDFAFNNVNNDPYPWFSGQHEVGIENGGAGPMTLFDNGNTRVLAGPPLGLGKNHCQPNDCDSRGMALTIDEAGMQVTPVLSQNLGVFSVVLGSAQLLSNGNYFFQPGDVRVRGTKVATSNSMEVFPTPGAITGTIVLNLQGSEGYRAWQMPSLYDPPTT